MSEEIIREIRIAKLQIMYSLFVSVFCLGLVLGVFANPLNFLFVILFIALWFWGVVYLRKQVELEEKENEVVEQ